MSGDQLKLKAMTVEGLEGRGRVPAHRRDGKSCSDAGDAVCGWCWCRSSWKRNDVERRAFLVDGKKRVYVWQLDDDL